MKILEYEFFIGRLYIRQKNNVKNMGSFVLSEVKMKAHTFTSTSYNIVGNESEEIPQGLIKLVALSDLPL